MIYDESISVASAIIGTIATFLFGGWDMALIVLCSFMAMDYFTGVIDGFVNKKLSSREGFKGILKKMVMLVVLMVAVLLDRLINDGDWLFRTLTCYFYIANEGISILENCANLGLPIHPKLKEALEQLREGKKKLNVTSEENTNKEDIK